MWIRSQDRKMLIKVIEVFVNNYEPSVVGLNEGRVDSAEVLGKYATRERAIEVLDEIQQFIIDCHQCQNDKMFSPIYEMPKE